MHSLAPRRGRDLFAASLLALIAAPGPEVRAAEGPAASDAALQQRIELLERQTATAKGGLAALEAAQRRLDARPSLEACVAFGELARAVGLEVDALSSRYGDLAAAADRYPDRKEAALQGREALVRVRDELLAHAVAVTGRCTALGASAESPAEPAPVLVPIGEGTARLAAGGSVVFWSGMDVGALARPDGGLQVARAIAGALDDLPEVLWVRLEGLNSDRFGLRASFLPGESAAGRSLLPQFVASPGALRGVVVLPFDGPIAETWALAGLARAFEREPGCAASVRPAPQVAGAAPPAAPMRFDAVERLHLNLSATPAESFGGWTPIAPTVAGSPGTCGDPGRRRAGGIGPSVGLVVVTGRAPTTERMTEIVRDWRAFVAAGPDRDPTTANFFEASDGGTCRPARLRPRAAGCTAGVPDLP